MLGIFSYNYVDMSKPSLVDHKFLKIDIEPPTPIPTPRTILAGDTFYESVPKVDLTFDFDRKNLSIMVNALIVLVLSLTIYWIFDTYNQKMENPEHFETPKVMSAAISMEDVLGPTLQYFDIGPIAHNVIDDSSDVFSIFH